jgi:hypothetical protein
MAEHHLCRCVVPSVAPQYVRLVEKVQTADQQDWRGRVQAEEGQQRYTSRAKREADVSLSHRCTMEHPVAPWSTTNATGVTTPRQTVKASHVNLKFAE